MRNLVAIGEKQQITKWIHKIPTYDRRRLDIEDDWIWMDSEPIRKTREPRLTPKAANECQKVPVIAGLPLEDCPWQPVRMLASTVAVLNTTFCKVSVFVTGVQHLARKCLTTSRKVCYNRTAWGVNGYVAFLQTVSERALVFELARFSA
jgi:hypothetical protein